MYHTDNHRSTKDVSCFVRHLRSVDATSYTQCYVIANVTFAVTSRMYGTEETRTATTPITTTRHLRTEQHLSLYCCYARCCDLWHMCFSLRVVCVCLFVIGLVYRVVLYVLFSSC
jgi:hypothetical protein